MDAQLCQRVDGDMGPKPRNLPCPYCGQPLRWVPLRWFSRGCYQCDQCGDFPDLDDAGRADHAQGESSQARAQVPPAHGDRPRVLLVDDAKAQRDLYALMLEGTATVVTAARGEEALEIATQTPLDAIILDVLMPGMGGWEVCGRLKESPATRDIPVIILTSLDGVDAAEPAHRAGAAAVLMKPCPIERLARTVEAVIDTQAHQAERPKDRSVVLPFRERASGDRRTSMILIVAPEELGVTALRQRLESVGYLTVAAESFPEGMRTLRAVHPDLLVAALRLDEFNGLQFVAASERHIPTIIVGDEPYDESEARALGAEYVSAPFEIATVMALVRRMVPVNRPAESIAPSRRWIRKPVTSFIPAQVGDHPAHLLNVSYGGMCLAIDSPRALIPTSVDVTFPASQRTVRAELVWRDQRDERTWLLGAEIPIVTDEWRLLVDAIS